MSIKKQVNINHKPGNQFELIHELQFSLKKKTIENFIKKCALAASGYHIQNEKNKRIFGRETNSVEFVVQRIMEDIRMKIFGLNLGYLGLDVEICKKWNIPIKNVDSLNRE